jgi:hypothetical protein
MDIAISDGGKELVLKGIYALDGDELKVCFGGPADNCPAEFISAGGSNEQMVVMKRDKVGDHQRLAATIQPHDDGYRPHN